MNVLDALKDEACSLELSSKSKEQCLKELSRLVASAAPGLDAGVVFTLLNDREKEGSTALADGVAIPHARTSLTGDFVLGIAISKRGVKFDSPDHKKTHIFFVLVGPENRPEDYLKLLALVSRVTKSMKARREIRNARTVNALKESFAQNSGLAPAHKPAGKMKLFTIVLYEQQYMDDISQLFLERGIRGALVTDSTGVKDVLTRVPLFANFLDFLGERRGSSKTISTIVEESEIPALVEGIEEILGDLDTHTGAFVYTTDVDFMKGSLETT
jgi:mannitol/fructose-specific phosphotransferase system IIA component (Ntr-type)